MSPAPAPGGERPSHPTIPALLVMIGVVLLIVALSVASVYF